jgi:hypothetical protein
MPSSIALLNANAPGTMKPRRYRKHQAFEQEPSATLTGVP